MASNPGAEVSLREITQDTVRAVIRLSVADQKLRFVATNKLDDEEIIMVLPFTPGAE